MIKKGLFKTLQHIEGKNEIQLIKDQGEKQLKELKNINKSKTLKALKTLKTYNYKITLHGAKENQDKLEKLITRLENYDAKKSKKKEETKKEFINNTLTFIEKKNINNDSLNTYFNFSTPIDLAKKNI